MDIFTEKLYSFLKGKATKGGETGMKLSDAIRKRKEINERARAMDEWYMEQGNKHNSIPWYDMNKAIKGVIDKTWEEYFEINNAIENFIEGMELPEEDEEQ